MRLHRFLASSFIAAGVLFVGPAGCGIESLDWKKIYTFGRASSFEHPDDPATALAPGVRAGQVVSPPADARIMVCQDPFGERTAYIRATPDAADHEKQHVFIDAGGNTWEILGLPHAGKPLENLHWEGRMLVVDRWRTPTDGVRIYIDSGTGRGTLAEAINRDAPATQP